ncbi:hypothetical protein [Nocardia amamiensis]|uniref:hypothetical protein n=1 Tax=Nocardia TaxID=1817 RepID=UPI0034027753
MSNAANWQKLAAQARAGELYLDDEEAARACLSACAQRIEELEGMAVLAQQAENVSGFGDFDMARALEAKFRSQAIGADHSLKEVIEHDIEVVKDMCDVMAISIARITGQDYTNSAAITAIIESK